MRHPVLASMIMILGAGLVAGCSGRAELAATNQRLAEQGAALLAPPGGNNSTMYYDAHEERTLPPAQ